MQNFKDVHDTKDLQKTSLAGMECTLLHLEFCMSLRGEGRCKYICFCFPNRQSDVAIAMDAELRIVVHESIALTILTLAVQVEISNAVLYGSVQT